jgi:hydroxysqualene dehydroxylase
VEGGHCGEKLDDQMIDPDVVVVGGGFAGLSAAVRLASAGYTPTVLERRPILGGRAYSFMDVEAGYQIDNGQHIFMRCCHSVISFLETIGSSSIHFESQFRIPFIDGTGAWHILSAPNWLPPSTGLLAAFLRFDPATWRDAVGLRRIQPYFDEPPADITVSQWLDTCKQSSSIRTTFWNPLCLSVMNASPEIAPARELVAVLSEAFAQQGGANMGWATTGLSETYAAQSRAYIEQRGGHVTTGAYVSSVEQANKGIAVGTRDQTGGETKAVILAVPPPRASSLLPPALKSLADQLKHLVPSPILGINLWFNRPLIDEPFVGLLGGMIEWVFNRAELTGRKNPDTGYHHSLVVSASGDLLSEPDSVLVQLALDDLRRAELIDQDESPLRSLVVHEKRATYVRPVGLPAVPNTTNVPGLYLAGDWTDTGLPPTIESAVRSGNQAAGLVISFLGTKKPKQ